MPSVIFRCEVCDEMVLEPQTWVHLDLGRHQRYGFHDECWSLYLHEPATAAPHLEGVEIHVFARHTGPATCAGCDGAIDDDGDRVTVVSSEPSKDGTVRYVSVYHPACARPALLALAPATDDGGQLPSR